jgi:hypothetical protein
VRSSPPAKPPTKRPSWYFSALAAAEVGAEAHLLFLGKRLAAKDQHRPLGPQPAQLAHGLRHLEQAVHALVDFEREVRVQDAGGEKG